MPSPRSKAPRTRWPSPRAWAPSPPSIFALCSTGDHIVAQRQLYAGTLAFLQGPCQRMGIETTLVDGTEPGAFAAAVGPGRTMLALAETPSNPRLELVDLEELGALRGPITVVDSTFATPLGQQPLAHGVHLSLHSATKGIAGHNDATLGVIAGERELIDGDLGVLGAARRHAVAVRRAQRHPRHPHARRAHRRTRRPRRLHIAEALADEPAVAAVHYPGLASHPQFDLAKRQMRHGGTVLAIELAGGREAATRFLDSLQLARVATSLGGPETLVCHPATSTHASLTPAEAAAMGVSEGLLRISVGLEDTADLVSDLTDALPADDRMTRVLCLHGMGGTGATMWPVVAACIDAGFTTLAPTLPGHGTDPSRPARRDVGRLARRGPGMGGRRRRRSVDGRRAWRCSSPPNTAAARWCASTRCAADPDAIEGLEWRRSRGHEWIDVEPVGVDEIAYERLPIEALIAMAEGVASRSIWPASIVPVLLITSDGDDVVDPASSDVIAGRWQRRTSAATAAQRPRGDARQGAAPWCSKPWSSSSVVVRVLADRVVGEVADPLDLGKLLDQHRLHAVEHRHAAHRAAVAAAAHRQVRSALAVVADVGDEAAVGRQRRVDLGLDQRLDLGAERVVGGQPFDGRRLAACSGCG